jgi:hypothetical protein
MNGQVYSPTEAALRCYAQAGSQRPTENGWRVWKNREGQTLNALFEQQQAQKEENLKQ